MFEGISAEIQHAIAGVLGGIISLVYTRKLSARSSIVTIIVSFIMSYFLGEVLANYLKIPATTAGFLVGLSALKLGAKLASGEWFHLSTLIGQKPEKNEDKPKQRQLSKKRNKND